MLHSSWLLKERAPLVIFPWMRFSPKPDAAPWMLWIQPILLCLEPPGPLRGLLRSRISPCHPGFKTILRLFLPVQWLVLTIPQRHPFRSPCSCISWIAFGNLFSIHLKRSFSRTPLLLPLSCRGWHRCRHLSRAPLSLLSLLVLSLLSLLVLSLGRSFRAQLQALRFLVLAPPYRLRH